MAYAFEEEQRDQLRDWSLTVGGIRASVIMGRRMETHFVVDIARLVPLFHYFGVNDFNCLWSCQQGGWDFLGGQRVPQDSCMRDTLRHGVHAEAGERRTGALDYFVASSSEVARILVPCVTAITGEVYFRRIHYYVIRCPHATWTESVYRLADELEPMQCVTPPELLFHFAVHRWTTDWDRGNIILRSSQVAALQGIGSIGPLQVWPQLPPLPECQRRCAQPSTPVARR